MPAYSRKTVSAPLEARFEGVRSSISAADIRALAAAAAIFGTGGGGLAPVGCNLLEVSVVEVIETTVSYTSRPAVNVSVRAADPLALGAAASASR